MPRCLRRHSYDCKGSPQENLTNRSVVLAATLLFAGTAAHANA
jgi:hypothetical protein